MRNYHKWNNYETDFMNKYYSETGTEICSKKLNLSRGANS
jgi:hypothetical protein